MSRVNPPKTTIPKTEPALANSQYAADLELFCGKNPDVDCRAVDCLRLLFLDTGACFRTRARTPNGVPGAAFTVLLNRVPPIACDLFGNCSVALAGRWRHFWHTKRSRESLGATRRIPENSEAITGA